MQYKIPQNVGIEDRIVGPLTLRQLIILAAGFGVSYVLFTILNRIYELNILEYIVIALPALLATAFALIKINDQTLAKFIVLFLEYSIKPKKRLWDHRGISSLVAPDLTEIKKGPMPEEVDLSKSRTNANLSELSTILDSGGFDHVRPTEHVDIDDVPDDDLVTEAYFGHKVSDTENMYWRTTESHKKRLELFAQMPVTQLKKGTKETAVAQAEIAKAKQEVEAMQAATAVQEAPAKTKKRKRKRNRSAKPARSRHESVINTTKPTGPAEYLPTESKPKKEAPKASNPAQKPEAKEGPKDGTRSGEFTFEDLKNDIEINLD